MERGVFEAALEGDVATLKRLLHEDPLILDRTIVNTYSETPLHVAAMLGYHDFVKEIITTKPQLVKELNSKHSSPLHLAAAKGHVDVVRALVLADPGMCKGRDRDGLTPLHLAAMKGRLEVLKELIDAIRKSSRSGGLVDMMGVDDERLGETILHLCVKHSQLEALKILVEMIGDGGEGFVNQRDSFGHTILHLAVADKQFETVKYLVKHTTIEVDAHQDLIGLTPMDDITAQLLMHKQGPKQASQQHINNDGQIQSPQSQQSRNKKKNKRKKPNNNNTNKPPNAKEHWVQKMRDAIMVAASLLATMAFQAVISPPGGLLQTNDTVIRESDIETPDLNGFFSITRNSDSFVAPAPSSINDGTLINARIGKSVMSYYKPPVYSLFLVANTTSFLASLSIILLLISGLPLNRKLFMYIMMIIMWVAITGMGFSYFLCINMITPDRNNMNIGLNLYKIGECLFAGLAVILVLGHTIQITVKMLKWVFRALKRKPKMNSSRSMDIDSCNEIYVT
ncbi:PREDICTED: ankyrin repeat-containing protein ITN1-like [Ipomoea nil]|uniref:ankyrin repeat-containing protein ITN1-like n=1 Tax=Ipomoea nil TaxID=35883 RepID=UPI000901105E|nr:PREDICTED: ankyrin repeat-containing protein ITN1-like [Ipomoea nil]